VATIVNLWTLRWFNTENGSGGSIVPPGDCNPGSDDEGMLVYRSLEAADKSAQHQTELYGDSETVARPIQLSEALELLK